MKLRVFVYAVAVTVAIVHAVVAHDVNFEKTEDDWNDFMCDAIGGEREVRHGFAYGDDDIDAEQDGHIIVDCETDAMVIEGGLDKRGSLDSLQQAIEASAMTGKVPAVVIYDTDNFLGPYEVRIQIACLQANIPFLLVTGNVEWLTKHWYLRSLMQYDKK